MIILDCVLQNLIHIISRANTSFRTLTVCLCVGIPNSTAVLHKINMGLVGFSFDLDGWNLWVSAEEA